MLKRVFLALSFVILAATFVQAQTAWGTYQYGSFDTPGFDTIDLGNLNVILTVPILNKRGRAGTNFVYNLTYNSSIYAPGTVSGSTAWVPDSNWGWSGRKFSKTGYTTSRTTAGTCSGVTEGPHGPVVHHYPYTRTTNFSYTDAQGGSHHFAGILINSGGLCDPSGTDPDPFPLSATDSSGLTWNEDGTITDQHRNIITPASGSPNLPSAFTDSNGNKISDHGDGTFTDTLGASPLTIAGTPPSNQTYNYVDASGTSRTITESYTVYNVRTNFGCSGVGDSSQPSSALVDRITMPDGSYYAFTYEPTPGSTTGEVTGRLASVQLPAGGIITYTYTGANNGINCTDGTSLGLSRTMTSAAGTPTRYYTRTVSGGNSHTTVVNEVGNHLDYDFVPGSDSTSLASNLYQTNLSITTSGSGTPLLAQQTCYNSASLPCTTQSLTLPITQVQSYSTLDGVTQSSSLAAYDTAGEYLGSTTYDFGTATAPGPSLLTDTRTYSGGLLSWDSVYDSTGSINYTTYTYDSAALQSTSGIPQHTSGTNYGNLTQVSVLTSIGGSSAPLTTNYTYYDTGSLYSQTSSSGGTTSYSYDSTNTHATTVTPPDPNSVGMASTYTYDAYLGQPASVTNPNGTITSVTTSDGYGHPAQVVTASGGTTLAKATSTTYPTQSSTISYQGSSITAETDTYYDSYGRPIRTATQSDSGHWYVVDTCYDAASRVSFKSYPYTVTSLGAEVCTGAGDTYYYDALGRTHQVLHGDSPQTSVSYLYYGNSTLVTNENSVSHIYQTDGAGRTTIVCELTSATMNGDSPGSCGTTYAGTGFVTTYGYAGTTTTVTQGSQTRTFVSDLAGRPISKQEPEGNTTTYAYSSNSTGNIVTRQKPKAGQTSTTTYTTTTTQYDQLGRVLSITYDDGVTPTKTFTYDTTPSGSSFGVGYAKGMVTAASTGTGASTLFSYDALGRVQNTSQCIPGWCGTGTPSALTRAYNYDWASNPTGESYGTASGGTLASLGYGVNLAGQLTSVTGGQDSSVSSSLYSAPTQTPFGPSATSLGNGVAATLTYDTFGRPNGLGLALGSAPLYAYTTTWSGKRVTAASDSVNGSGAYGYDSLNRLSTAAMTTSAGTLNLSWGYDRYGNRLSQSASGSYTGSVSQPSFSVDATTNRLTSSGYTYDAAGNLMTDGVNTYTYDAEGNLIGVSGGTSATFTFDALNQRVLTVIGGTTRAYGFNLAGQRATVWDGSGNLISAQYYAAGQPFAYYLASDGHVRFQHQDWLGTERFRTTYTGSVEGSFTSLPFGDSTATASGTDTDAYHYAGTDADTTDLQHATFRQYSAIQGRWLRPDPYDGSYHFGNPQSFNRYAYTKNNPLSRTDASGLDDGSEDDGNPCDSEQDCEQRDDPIWATEGGGGGGDDGGEAGQPVVVDDGSGGYTIHVGVIVTDGFAFKVDPSLFDWSSLLNYSNLSANFFLQAAGGGPNNQSPKPVKIHGNWCGPDWTGGQAGPYNPQVDAAGGYKPPVDSLDGSCMQHDKCYAACRQSNACDASARGSCFAKCDLGLASATNSEISMAGAAINILFSFRSTNTWPFRPDPYPNPASCQVQH